MQVVVIADTNEAVLQSMYHVWEAILHTDPKDGVFMERLMTVKRQSSMHECVELTSFANWQALCLLL